MTSKRKWSYDERHVKRPRAQIPQPGHYSCPVGSAYIHIHGQRIRIKVLLDSGSNVFLINERLVDQHEIPYEERKDPVPIVGFDGAAAPSAGKRYTHPLSLEIGNRHMSEVACEIGESKYGMIIPFGWWYEEHHMSNVGSPDKWQFEHDDCKYHCNITEDPDITVEWDDMVVYDPRAQYIGRIEWVAPYRMVNRVQAGEEGKVKLIPDLPDEYQNFKSLFQPATAEKLPPRRTFDHAINLEKGAKPPWGPIYPLSEKQLKALREYLEKMMKEKKITRSDSPAGAPILFVPKPDGRLRLVVDYRNLNKITIHDKYPLPLMNKLRDRVKDAKIFTKLNLKDGYHLIRIKKGDEWKTAFRTRYGLYQY
jgi:hypothetical protein